MGAIPWLAEVLRAAGVQVVEHGDWRNRYVTGSFSPIGVLWHHTAATSSASNPAPALNVCINGRSDLRGPLCHALVDYHGVFHVISGGRANHAGASGGSGPIPAGDGNTMLIGWEIDYNGVSQSMSGAQYSASLAATAAVLRRLNRDATFARGHRETSITGKIDPSFVNLNTMRAQVASLMAGGGGSGDQEGASVVVGPSGAMQAFARDQRTGTLVTTWQSAPGSLWSGWTALGTSGVGTPAAMLDYLGQMDVFTRRADGHLIEMWQSGSGTPIDHGNDLGGSFSGDPVVVTKPSKVKVVFIRGIDGQLWHKWQSTPGGSFGVSQLLRDDVGVVLGKPSVLVDALGRVSAYVVRADKHLITLWQKTAGGPFDGMDDLGGDYAGDPVAVRKSDGAHVVFARGSDGQLWHKWQTSAGASFGGAVLVRADLGQVLGNPAVVVTPGNAIQVFIRRSDRRLVTTWQSTAGRPFDGFDDIGGTLVSDPTIASRSDGIDAAFARFPDGSILTTWQDTPTGPFRRTWTFLNTQ